MKNINVNHAIKAVIVLMGILAAVVYIAMGRPTLDWRVAIDVFSKALSIEMGILWLFYKFTWNWRAFRGWLVLTPDLSGTWKGEIRSTWKAEETGERFDPIPALLTIRQTLFHLSCVMRTEEMTSSSFSAGFVIDEDNQKAEICYSYNSLPTQVVIERSPQHLGTALLEIDEKPKRSLCGHYWSGRKTSGDLEFNFWNKEKLKCFPDDLRRKHPVSLSRDYKD